MSGNTFLPHPSVVVRWKEDKVIKWLKQVHLEDCIPAFQARHIDGARLMELSEQNLFSYQDLKIKHRKQIARCVQECRSRAGNAQRFAQTLQRSQPQQDVDANGHETDDSGDWGSDFEDESDGEGTPSPELNNNTLSQSLEDAISQSSCVSESLPTSEKSIPKPPDVPVISNSLSGRSIPRLPLKRPPSQPPPPPVSLVHDPPEDYEVPILTKQDSATPSPREATLAETYELIEPPEEEYEVVDAPTSVPAVPPRLSPSPPPPLPQKPWRLKEALPPSGSLQTRRVSNSSPLPREAATERDSGTFTDEQKMPLPPLASHSPLHAADDSAQNMATRPLPPVPLPKENPSATEQELSACPWFHLVEREEAESKVRSLGESGSFLVRPGRRAGRQNPYSMTVLHAERIFHLNIREREDGTFALGKEKRNEKNFLSVPELVRHHRGEPIGLTYRGEPAGKTRLRKYPEKSEA